MKKTLLAAIALASLGTASAQTIYSENFNTATPNQMPAGMTEVNNDGSVPNAALATYNFENHGWVTLAGNGGNILAISYSYMTPQADDWMITPAIILDGDCQVKWKGAVQYAAPNNDGYDVRLSTTNTDLASFTEVIYSTDGEVATGQFIPHTADLSAYAGQTVYIAFRNNSKSRTLLIMDDIEVVKYTPTVDLKLNDLTMLKYAPTGSSDKITAVLSNVASKTITSFDFYYSINGGAATKETVTGISVYGGAAYTYEAQGSLNRATNGTYPVKAWIANINGAGADNSAANDTVSANFYAYSGTVPEKRVVIEEGTGTWCQFCPRGTVYMDSIAKVHPDKAVLIAVHNNDPMVNAVYDAGFRTQITGFPSVLVDRKTLTDPLYIFTEFNKNKDLYGLANLNFTATYDATTKKVTGDLAATFAAPADGDFRVAMVITENHVTGTTAAYNQVNYYSGGTTPMGGYENKANPVPAAQMVYDFVAREIVGGFNGMAGSLPASIAAGETKTYSFSSAAIPATYKKENLKAHVLLIDTKYNRIYNAKTVNISNASGIADVAAVKIENVSLYPNPVQSELNVKFNVVEAEQVFVSVVNVTGQTVIAIPGTNYGVGEQSLRIPASELAAGAYFLQIGTAKGVVSEGFVKN
ncbi:MAG: choice-of-anchor J domain-containing protein [Bacteroidota bacterium]